MEPEALGGGPGPSKCEIHALLLNTPGMVCTCLLEGEEGSSVSFFLGSNPVPTGPAESCPPRALSPERERGSGPPVGGDPPCKNFSGNPTLEKFLGKSTPTTPQTTPGAPERAPSVQKGGAAFGSSLITEGSPPSLRGDPPRRNF